MTTPIYAVPDWSGSQSSPWLIVNQAARVHEAVMRGSVLDRDLTAPPGTCADGATYLVAASATGAWAGKDGLMAIANGTNASSGWLYADIATEGFLLYVEDEATLLQYVSAAWAAFLGGSPSLNLASTVTQSGTPVATSVGFLGSPQIADQDAYTLALTDAGGHYYHVSATPHTLTIPANASVAFPIGTVIAIVNENGAGAITLAITSDTLRWGSSTGSRTIAANGTASLLKVTSTMWRLTGDGIT